MKKIINWKNVKVGHPPSKKDINTPEKVSKAILEDIKFCIKHLESRDIIEDNNNLFLFEATSTLRDLLNERMKDRIEIAIVRQDGTLYDNSTFTACDLKQQIALYDKNTVHDAGIISEGMCPSTTKSKKILATLICTKPVIYRLDDVNGGEHE